MYSPIRILFICLFLIFYCRSTATDSTTITKRTPVQTIWDIPHTTPWEKWMWIHRSIAYVITKERNPDFDTNYIKSYYDHLLITLPVTSQFLQFSLTDPKSGNTLTFSPNMESELGVSVSSRWASFIVNTGVKLYSSDAANIAETRYQDYQLNLYERKFTTDMFFQSYKGFYIKNSGSYNLVNEHPQALRTDVEAVNMGASTYYITNYRQFSYKNSFAFVEQQKKSAGSLLIGVYYSYFQASGNPVLVSASFRTSFDSLSYISKSSHPKLRVKLWLHLYICIFEKMLCHRIVGSGRGCAAFVL